MTARLSSIVRCSPLVSWVCLVGCDFPHEWGLGRDPLGPPARAAITITPSTETGQCVLPHFSIPPDPPGNPGAIHEALFCDLQDPSCKPDEYAVAQGEPDVTVACTISPSGDSFDVTIEVRQRDLYFEAHGTIASDGGTLDVSQESGGQKVRDRGCKVSIRSNHGSVKKGAVWAQFECEIVAGPDGSNGATCTEGGAFILENCGS